jgi:hypothetical protein
LQKFAEATGSRLRIAFEGEAGRPKGKAA